MQILSDNTEPFMDYYKKKWKRKVVFKEITPDDVISIVKWVESEYNGLSYSFDAKSSADYLLSRSPFHEFQYKLYKLEFSKITSVRFSCHGEEWDLKVELDVRNRSMDIIPNFHLINDRGYYQDDRNGTIVRHLNHYLDVWEGPEKKWVRRYGGDDSYAREIWLGQGNNCLDDISKETALKEVEKQGGSYEDFMQFDDTLLKEILRDREWTEEYYGPLIKKEQGC